MKPRNLVLDIFKLILVFFVVTAHLLPYEFDNKYLSFLSNVIHGICRTAVPLFFIISGYFISNKIHSLKNLKTSLVRFAKLFLVWQTLYTFLAFSLYKNNLLTIEEIILSSIYGFGHLWYLNALFFGILLVYLFRNWSAKNKLYLSITLIILGYLIQTFFELNLLSENLVRIYKYIGTTRNFLFFGFPYILLGTIIDNLKIKSNLKLTALMLILVILESFTYKINSINISNFFIAALPFGLYSFSHIKTLKTKSSFLINSKLVLGIYLIHFYIVYFLIVYYPSASFFITIIKIFGTFASSIVIFFILNNLDKKFKLLF